ncbi:MAG: nucleoside-diphosphate-sugar epimerase [Bacteroidia bacterium]|jgi:nucleoside-diphosphate-sugar epimerase
MENRKHVFITGASSELMRQVLSRLDSETYLVTGLTRLKNQTESGLVKWVFGDINQPDTYKAELSKADVVIHAAALTHSKKQDAYFKVNVEGTKALINALPEGGNPKFVFISSRVAGEKSGAYGITKLRAEEEVKKLTDWIIIRPSEVYGGTKTEGIEKTIHEAINGGVQLCPVGVESKMYPIHITDTVNVIFEAAFGSTTGNRTITLNGPHGYSFKELLTLIERVSGKKMTVIPIPKWFLGLVGFASKWIPMDIGFVPDQVDRLYSVKSHNEATTASIDLENYIRGIVKSQNG